MEWFAILKSDLIKESKLKKINYDAFQDLLTGLNNTGLITSDVKLVDRKYRKRKNDSKKQMWNINFLKDDGEIAFVISNYINIVYRYLNYVYGGYFECEICGGMFIQSNKNNRVYCNQCSKYQPIETKTITCIDCGKKVEVDSKDNETCRCEVHREEHLKLLNRKRQKEWYYRQK